MLHVAPETCLVDLFSNACGDGYLTADLLSDQVMQKMDVTNIPYPNDSFDSIVCSHVLEHVPDDRAVMREFYRVLRPGGWAILNFPITGEATFEDSTITSPEDRLRVFGQEDHVRIYGPDYLERLQEAGFCVEVVHAQDLLVESELVRQSMTNAARGEIYWCTKPSIHPTASVNPIACD